MTWRFLPSPESSQRRWCSHWFSFCIIEKFSPLVASISRIFSIPLLYCRWRCFCFSLPCVCYCQVSIAGLREGWNFEETGEKKNKQTFFTLSSSVTESCGVGLTPTQSGCDSLSSVRRSPFPGARLFPTVSYQFS